jgi:hypothetical protein
MACEYSAPNSPRNPSLARSLSSDSGGGTPTPLSLAEPLQALKPSGELEERFVQFRYSDFVRLQEVLEENIEARETAAAARDKPNHVTPAPDAE